jgi:hypothetical protein
METVGPSRRAARASLTPTTTQTQMYTYSTAVALSAKTKQHPLKQEYHQYRNSKILASSADLQDGSILR